MIKEADYGWLMVSREALLNFLVFSSVENPKIGIQERNAADFPGLLTPSTSIAENVSLSISYCILNGPPMLYKHSTSFQIPTKDCVHNHYNIILISYRENIVKVRS